jgi:diaminopimelate decarboxylase
VVTLLDHLPSLRRAAAQRIAAGKWPDTTVVDELGRLCVGGIALTDLAAEFGSPVAVLDETDARHRLHRYRAAAGDVVPVVAGAALPTTVMRWVDGEGLGLSIRHARDLAAARAAGVRAARTVLHSRNLSHDELVAGAATQPGRIVVESAMDVAYLGNAVPGRQRVLVGAVDGSPDPAVIERVLHDQRLELVGFHGSAGDDVEGCVRSLLSSTWQTRRRHGTLLTEIHLVADTDTGPAELAAATGDALDAACAATRLPRPRLVVEYRWPITVLAAVTVCRVNAVLGSTTGPRVVVVEAGAGRPSDGVVALANRHPLSPTERMVVLAGDVELARGVELPCDVHAGDVLALARTDAAEGVPLVAADDGVPHALVRRMTVADMLSRDVGYSAGHDQHVGGLHPDGHSLPGGELPGP